MAGTASDRATEHARARAGETDNQRQGRSGGASPRKMGPANSGSPLKTNPTKGNKINGRM